jgi:predicted XRE-type DNA-binding protein
MFKKSKKNLVSRAAKHLGEMLDLSESDIALMQYKADLSRIAVKSITASQMSVNEIVEKSGVSRSKVSAIKNGATINVSIDLLLRIIAATGTKITIRAA